jgi:type I restriction enzyme M protein
MLFLMICESNDETQHGIGSRIASVHSGSALFTVDAGGGAS